MRIRLVFGILALMALLLGGSALAQAYPPYLALGDSIDFGYITNGGFTYVNPTNFQSFSDYVGATNHLAPMNAGCPGETSASFLDTTAPDHGCQYFRAHFPLHTAYTTSQMDFAAAYLKAHPNTKLVTLQLGANDGFMLEDFCMTQADPLTCIQTGLTGVLTNVYLNVGTVIDNLRKAGFHGIIIVVNYYSTDYTDANATGLSVALNATLANIAQAKGAYVADVFTAFQSASQKAFVPGKTCYAGLLNSSPADQFSCDVHPTLSGHQLMAKVIGATYKAALAMQ